MSKEERQRSEQAGREGEAQAERYLVSCGYDILASRYRSGHGEIDIIAARGNLVIFVEVKVRPDVETGLRAITVRQQKRILAGASAFIAAHPDYAGCDQRVDAIILVPGASPVHIEHIITSSEALF